MLSVRPHVYAGMWPSPVLADIAVQRLRQHDHPYPVGHRQYPRAGHGFVLPNWPTSLARRHAVLGKTMVYGGSVAANARAAAAAWRATLAFLDAWRP
jgi:hypothetical protein